MKRDKYFWLQELILGFCVLTGSGSVFNIVFEEQRGTTMLITWHLVIVTLVYLISGQCVICTEMIRRDPGHNITVTWMFHRGKHPLFVEIKHVTTCGSRGILSCPTFDFCAVIYGTDHIRLATVPPFNSSAPNEDDITRIGIFATSIRPSDAGLYRIQSDFFRHWKHEVIFYIYQKPTKPVITSTSRVNEVILTCSSNLQSLPEEFRNSSLLEYTWIYSIIMILMTTRSR